MHIDSNSTCQRGMSSRIASILNRNHKTTHSSRKRRRPRQYSFGTISDTTICAPIEATTTTTSSRSNMPFRRGTTRQLLLATLFLTIQVVSTSASNTATIDNHAKAVWEAIDIEASSSLRKSNLLLQQESSSTSDSSHRSLRGRAKARERARERLRKDHIITDYHYPATKEERHRLLVSCDETQRQDACLSQILEKYDIPYGEGNNDLRHHIEVVHNLESTHSLSIDVDSETMDKLAADGKFDFEMDFARGPLVLEGSMSIYEPVENNGNRNLQDAQQIPWGLDAIRAQEVWEKHGVQGEGVKICILDSGLMASHEDFRQSKFDGYYGNEFVSPYWYEDNKGHGTHIAGTIAASDNTIGIVGIAPKAETYIVRVFDDDRNFYGFADGTAYSTDLIAAATICKDWGAHIINASLGGSSYSRVEEEFFRSMYYDYGILTVAASGNGGNDQNVYPAAYEGVLSVGAVDEYLEMARFSTYDPSTTDVLAPGVNILSTFKDNVYATFSGTSMAAPHATGALALMLNYITKMRINISTEEIFQVLKHTVASNQTAQDAGSEASNDNGDTPPSMGVIDVFASIEYLESYQNGGNGRTPLIPPKAPSPLKCENEVRLDITTDSKGGDIFYRLMRVSDREVIWMQSPDVLQNFSTYSEKSCFEGPEACYQFDIRDRGADGILEGGGIEIIYDGHTLYKGGNFGRGGMLRFGNCGN